ncbi:MAG: hypothetical protein KDD67_06325 [Ignavibacteriae bacterium]|nr:hypothetical protein [Ignavibacteriota bacterium]MCB9215551.1 hypothetical protein [Ignavibacteria bacterium]
MSLLEKLFPKDEVQKPSSKLVERGLEALRLARDERGMMMGDVRRVPSHFELRLSTNRYEELVRMDALRDLEFHFKDELMKEMALEKSRTFGDHTLHVRIAADPGLGDKEIYAMILNPERRPTGGGAVQQNRSAGQVSEDATRVLSDEVEMLEEPMEEGDAATVMLGEVQPTPPTYRLHLRFPDGTEREEDAGGSRLIVGRRGTSGTPIPENFRKVELDFPTTVSREQLRLEVEDHSVLVTNIGKGTTSFADGQILGGGDSRRIRVGEPIVVEGIEVRVTVVSP